MQAPKRLSFGIRTLLVVTTLAAIVIATAAWLHESLSSAAIHQRSVTRELARWAKEYGHIGSNADAVRTAEMLGYVQHYYVVADGYRSTPDVELELEKQRQITVDTFTAALREYTGQNKGTDSAAWLAYLGTSH